MEATSIRSNDKALEAALAAVRDMPGEAQKFVSDPESYLKAKGVATEGLRFNAEELSDDDLSAVSGGRAPTICASVGVIVCGSVGGEI
ncbi:MAG: class IIb bacteriocin, lactobin A/cerein 7B family [Myxococcales bacterium]|jgi:lactobin A/cerein 7B family class IIb bacteriocin|nr:class IIb bacteriocin, lactobin A/cerein 7B family [Myxococcales bacterium]